MAKKKGSSRAKKSSGSKSSGLTAGQKKLPPELQKAILRKKKR